MSLYTANLMLHSAVRWLVLALGAACLLRSTLALRTRAAFTAKDAQLGQAFLGAVNIQFVLGLALWLGTSPLPDVARRTGLFTVPASAFFVLVHPLAMVAAVGVFHVGEARQKRPLSDGLRHRTRLVCVAAGLAIVLASIPWPPLAWGRPLWRLP
jgi:hypothetical protein